MTFEQFGSSCFELNFWLEINYLGLVFTSIINQKWAIVPVERA